MFELIWWIKLFTIRRVWNVWIERLAGTRKRLAQVPQAHKMSMLTIRRFLLNYFIILIITFFLVARRRFPILLLRFPLDLLHFRPLILEPHLDHSNAQTGLLGEGFSHFSTGLRAHFERGLELSSLSRCQDRSRSFWPSSAVSGSANTQKHKFY